MKTDYRPLILFVIRLVIGVTFVYSSYHKIEDPAGFAKIIYGYAVFPHLSINIIAIIFPFIELIAGFCLIFNLFPRSAVLIINWMLVVFILLIGFNLLRGHQFDCGCFSSKASNNPVLLNVFALIRDVIFLGAGIYLFKYMKPVRRKKVTRFF